MECWFGFEFLVRFVGDTDSDPISGEGIVKNNFANKGAKIWKVFYGNNVFDGSTQIDSKPVGGIKIIDKFI